MMGRELFELIYSLPAGAWVFMCLTGAVLLGSFETFVRLFSTPAQEIKDRSARLRHLLGQKTTRESADPSYRQSADANDMVAIKKRIDELEEWNMAFAEQLINQTTDIVWLIRRLQFMVVLIVVNMFLMAIVLALLKGWLEQ